MPTPVESFLQADRAHERSRINDMENGGDQKNFEKTREMGKMRSIGKTEIFREFLDLEGWEEFSFWEID